MNKSYVIQWKSTVNGRAGRGTKLFDKESAERLVIELIREYPQIVHECVETQAETPQRTEEPSFNPTPLLSIA
jgi:hypothetical protein